MVYMEQHRKAPHFAPLSGYDECRQSLRSSSPGNSIRLRVDAGNEDNVSEYSLRQRWRLTLLDGQREAERDKPDQVKRSR